MMIKKILQVFFSYWDNKFSSFPRLFLAALDARVFYAFPPTSSLLDFFRVHSYFFTIEIFRRWFYDAVEERTIFLCENFYSMMNLFVPISRKSEAMTMSNKVIWNDGEGIAVKKNWWYYDSDERWTRRFSFNKCNRRWLRDSLKEEENFFPFYVEKLYNFPFKLCSRASAQQIERCYPAAADWNVIACYQQSNEIEIKETSFLSFTFFCRFMATIRNVTKEKKEKSHKMWIQYPHYWLGHACCRVRGGKKITERISEDMRFLLRKQLQIRFHFTRIFLFMACVRLSWVWVSNAINNLKLQ